MERETKKALKPKTKKALKAKVAKEVTIASVFSFVALIITWAGIVIPDKTFNIFAVVGTVGGSALGGATGKKAMWWAVPLNVILFAGAAIFYFIFVQTGSADAPLVAGLAISFTIMFLSMVYLLRMAGIAFLPKSGDT